MRRLGLILLLASGCGGQIDFAREGEARQVVWSSYGETSAVPALIFVTQVSLNCNPGPATGRFYGYREGKTLGTASLDGPCVMGQMFLAERTAQLALADGWNYSDTSLAHEFYHAHRDALTNDPDYDHSDPGFGERYGHPPGGAVDATNKALVMLGL